MGVIIRQSAFSTALSYLGIVVGFINVLYLYPRYFEAEEIGLVRVIQDMALIFAPFAQLGISQAIIKFFPEIREKDQQGIKSFFSASLSVALLGFALFAIVFMIFYEPITSMFSARAPQVNQYLNLVLFLTFIVVIFELLVAFSKAKLNLIMPSYLREVNTRFLVFVLILIYTSQAIDFNQYVYGIVSIYTINTLILFVYLLTKGHLNEFSLSFDFSQIPVRSIIKYGSFTVLGAGGALIIGKVDSVMVTSLMGLFENGIYTTAFFMAVVIEIPTRMILQISMPVISTALARNEIDIVAEIYKKTALNQLILGFLLLILIWTNIDNIYAFIPNNEIYSLGKYVVLIVGIGKLINMGFGSNGEIIVMSKYYKVNIYLVLLMAAVTIALNYYLIPIYGMEGAAIGSAVAYLLFNISKYLFIRSRFDLDPFSWRTLVVLVVGLICFLISYLIPLILHPLVDIVVRSILLCILFAGSIYWLKISEDFNKVIRNLLKLNLKLDQ